MGILDSLLKGGKGQSSDTTNPSAIGGIIEMLTSGNTGGIQGLISKLTASGLGSKVGSWIGLGENEPVEPQQLENALGSDMIEKFASKMGISHSEAASQLSKQLPTVVDKLTPEGKVPESGDLGNVQDLLKKFF